MKKSLILATLLAALGTVGALRATQSPPQAPAACCGGESCCNGGDCCTAR